MTEPSETNDAEPAPAPTEGGPGDVESAGETTAAAAIKGPDNPKPVGADTMVKVDGAPGSREPS